MNMPCRLTAVTLILLTCIIVPSCGGKEMVTAADVTPDSDTEVTSDNADVAPDNADVAPNSAVDVALDIAPDSVLNVIPQDTIGVIYIPSLLGLNDEINALMLEMIPADPPQELPAKMLADTFGAGFETLAELEELGLDMRRNFAVFLSGVNPPMPSAAVHVKDAESIKQLIEMEAEGSSAVTHNGVTYHTTGEEGAFVLMDDVMVYSSSAKVCEKVIDTQKKMMPSIAANPDFRTLQLDTTSGVNDLVAYFAMDAIVDGLRPMLTEKAEELKMGMEASAEADPELNAGLGSAESLIDSGIWMLDQSKTLSLTVQLNGSDLQLSPYLKFKPESEIQKYIHHMPRELAHLKYLPQNAFFNGEMQFQKEMLIDLTQTMLKLFIPSDPDADTAGIGKASEALTEATTGFYEGLGDELAFSVNFSESMMPDLLYIYNVTDEKQVKAYMETEFTEYLGASMRFTQAMGAGQEIAGMYADVSAGPPEIYNGVEIKNYVLPNITALFSELPPGWERVVPEQWNVYYALSGGKMLYAMAGSAQPIKNTLDRMAGMGTGFDQGEGYAKLTGALTLENNMFFAISPITAVKNLVQIFAQVDPNIGMIQMFLVDIPETYSIGIASQNRDEGIAGELFISLGDFKEIIAIIAGLQQMGGMQ